MSNEIENDFYQPNSNWPTEAVEIYGDLMELTKEGKWVKYSAPRIDDQDEDTFRSYTRSAGDKTFSGAMFFNQEEKLGKAVIVFQKWAQGGKGLAHGGAMAMLYDAFFGTLASRATLFPTIVTANLNINYKSPLPLLKTFCIDGKVERIDGRKVYLAASMKNTDGSIVYSDATALFIKISRENSDSKEKSSFYEGPGGLQSEAIDVLL